MCIIRNSFVTNICHFSLVRLFIYLVSYTYYLFICLFILVWIYTFILYFGLICQYCTA